MAMSGLTRDDARSIIADARKKAGDLRAETKRFLSDSLYGFKDLETLQSVHHLYPKDSQFVYELIQNADDNSYLTAAGNGEEPFLKFQLHRERIVIDSNEDGFSKENVSTICAVGVSTKKHSVDYLGEKGIGFKSVFKVARKVHIQSEPFSFSFSHTREEDNDGLGLITPHDEDAEELPVDVRTRITLTLLDDVGFDELASGFQNIPDSFLMFSARLKRVYIDIYPPGGCTTMTQYSKREMNENGLYVTFLTKAKRVKDTESSSEQKYYTVRKDLHGFPLDERRTDQHVKSIDNAAIILGFPVDEHNNPVLEKQRTYAFLPLCRTEFKFLIQADLITQANRQDVVQCNQNQAVLEAVAGALVDAAKLFCNHPSLRYRWMRYLPEETSSDKFWGSLWTQVRERLEQSHLLESWSSSGLYKPSELQRLSGPALDKDGSPLLADLEGSEIYLSPKYTEEDFQLLKRLGTKLLQWHKFVDRFEVDISFPKGSRWRNFKRTSDWRTRMCNCLSKPFHSMGRLAEQNRLRELALIPLQDGNWESSVSRTKLFFPNTKDVSIPADIGLNLVHHSVTANDAWDDLCRILGVSDCSPNSVISSINNVYDAVDFNNFTVSNGVAHAKYLFSFLPGQELRSPSPVRLANQYGFLLRKGEYLYFPDGKDEYSPTKLFRSGDQLLGHPVNYLNEQYLNAVDSEHIRDGWSWRDWLEIIGGARCITELLEQGHEELSTEFQFIINHRSDKLFEILRRGWSTYRLQMNEGAKKQLRESTVLLQNGQREQLQHIYLPFPKLKTIASELQLANSYPFIAMVDLPQDEEQKDWNFVKDMGVKIEDDLEFYLNALVAFRKAHFISPYSAKDELIKIYSNIQSRWIEGIMRVRRLFKQSFILAPSSNKAKATWLSVANCVWDGPQWLMSKQCLKHEAYVGLFPLFKLYLGIPDASKTDVINDLLILKSQSKEKNGSKDQSLLSTVSSKGTLKVPFQPKFEKDYVESLQYQSITFMTAFENQSFEELRLTDVRLEKESSNPKLILKSLGDITDIESGGVAQAAEERYSFLWREYSSMIDSDLSQSLKALRSTFDESGLVYVPKENAWYPPSKCVWADSSIKISQRASIADAYPSKESFFKTVLKVSPPTNKMYIDSLIAGAQNEKNPSKTQVKKIMSLICRLGIEETDFFSVNGLIGAKILPVKLANGASTFVSASTKVKLLHDYAIMDNTLHWKAFNGKINVLDFTLEEIRGTRSLLLALGLEERFSMKLVREVTQASGSTKDGEMTQKVRNKSQAIVRFILHFAALDDDQDAASLYRKFKQVVVYISDSIELSMSILQSDKIVEGVPSRASFHLEETVDSLRFYLPEDEVERDLCFESDMPRRLCQFLGIADAAAPAVLGSILRKDKPTVIEKILENAGVGRVDCDFARLDRELGVPDSALEKDIRAIKSALDDEALVEPVRSSHLTGSDSASNSSLHAPFTVSKQIESRPEVQIIETLRGEASIPTQSSVERQKETQETAYRRILENAATVARRRAQLGQLESNGTSTKVLTATKGLSPVTIQEAFAVCSEERDSKVAATGELYIFEYLKGLSLPAFSTMCWKSAIRDRAKLHPNYHDLEKGNDRTAIADIEYLDVSSKLTKFLIQKGHLTSRVWENQRPLYLIEVKTTTSYNWQEPFLIDEAQERHILLNRIDLGKTRSNIWLICRLFNLGQGDETGVHVYLDPETKKKNVELEFSARTSWAIKPLIHPTKKTASSITPASIAQRADVGVTSGAADNYTGTGDARNEPIPSKSKSLESGGVFGGHIRSRSAGTTASPIFESQRSDEYPTSNPFPKYFGHTSDNLSTKGRPKTGAFGSTTSSSLGGPFGRPMGCTATSDTSKAPSAGIFDSNLTPKGGLFGSSATSSSRSQHTNADGPKIPSLNLFGPSEITSREGSLKSADPKSPFVFDSSTRTASESTFKDTSSSDTGSPNSNSGFRFGSITLSSNPYIPRATSSGSICSTSGKETSEGIFPNGSSLFGIRTTSSSDQAPRASFSGTIFGTPAKDVSRGRPLAELGLLEVSASSNKTPRSTSTPSIFSPITRDVSKAASPSGADIFGSGSPGSDSSKSSSIARFLGSEDGDVGNDPPQISAASRAIGQKGASSRDSGSLPGPPTFSFGTSPFASSNQGKPKAVIAKDPEATSTSSTQQDNPQMPRARSPFSAKPATTTSGAPNTSPFFSALGVTGSNFSPSTSDVHGQTSSTDTTSNSLFGSTTILPQRSPAQNPFGSFKPAFATLSSPPGGKTTGKASGIAGSVSDLVVASPKIQLETNRNSQDLLSGAIESNRTAPSASRSILWPSVPIPRPRSPRTETVEQNANLSD